ncbi:anhydro-N-acetylmuramic acid kinase [Simiduia sp. 21SJ11W-1]|uniref:anhydro-N-acetylmuramic acid kinase n=1 Tax=Simiduia sp. 21SJ11W-1 TaxID=2909669 RepID=UPI00209CE826|nr:anhydro-N-acetylmuramic acid kinase [Simiduia sp. 21SJ11W-1]UTA48415.1 anhydro-N-acetylmuramic acid kinase [Simiduia sp. 21SJ11W-1]
MDGLYIGLMSGTSLDGIDAVLVNINDQQCELVRHHYAPLHDQLRERLLRVLDEQHLSLPELCAIDAQLGLQFADAANQLITRKDRVIAIGSHGQTLAHYPTGPFANSLQIGDANRIARQTGITTVTDFRRADVAAGGQGAPLAPAFHAQLFATHGHRYVLNLGGMANLTHLEGERVMGGFDVGPGNVLMDGWIKQQRGYDYDAGGDWARTGRVDDALLAAFMATPFVQEPPPKSTGRELFNADFLARHLDGRNLAAADVQATLTEFTAACVSQALAGLPPGDLVVCGGGAHNQLLMERLTQRTKRATYSSEHLGVNPDYLEAMAFAWFARATLNQVPLRLAGATGASENTVAGAIYFAPNLRLTVNEP